MTASSTPTSPKCSNKSSKTVASPSQQQQQQPPRVGETLSHVQQRFRRNCIVGPVAFCLIVIVCFVSDAGIKAASSAFIPLSRCCTKHYVLAYNRSPS